MHPRITSPSPKSRSHLENPGRPSGTRRRGTTPASTRRKPGADTAEWDACSAIREATAGAFQALAVIVGFVVFGMSWALIADASQSPPERVPPSASVGWLASDEASDERSAEGSGPAGVWSAYDVDVDVDVDVGSDLDSRNSASATGVELQSHASHRAIGPELNNDATSDYKTSSLSDPDGCPR